MTTQISIPQQALRVAETAPFTALVTTVRATLPTLADIAVPAGQALRAEAARLGLSITGPVQWIYTGVSGDEANEFRVDLALPIAATNQTPAAGFTVQNVPAFRCGTYTYTGPWSDFGELYDQLFAQFYRDGHKNDGRVREIYAVVDLANLQNCVTEIQIGIA